jgi:putative hydrolase of the HAD superfamily
MSATRGLLVDYGGVLTNPLIDTVTRYAELNRIRPEHIAAAASRVADELGMPPMAALEIAAISEAEFVALMSSALLRLTGKTLDAGKFHEQWFAGRTPNRELIAYLLGLDTARTRLALVTNNVREWRPFWRANVPPELFGVIVDSSAEGVRKPDPRFFEIALERIGLPADRCVLVDDTAENCVAAKELGIRTVQFVDTEQAIAAIEWELAS